MPVNAAGLAGFALLLAVAPVAGAKLPKGFVYLRDVAPEIERDMRYASARKFTGAPVPGYEAPECILTEPAAQALKPVNAALSATSKGLKVFDCFSVLSSTEHPDITGPAHQNRMALKSVMEAEGFENCHREWWHFTLTSEPFPQTYFDFPIEALEQHR